MSSQMTERSTVMTSSTGNNDKREIISRFKPSTSILKIPLPQFQEIVDYLGDNLKQLVAALDDCPYRDQDVRRFAMTPRSNGGPIWSLLSDLSSRGKTIEYFIRALDKLKYEEPQLHIRARVPVSILYQPKAYIRIRSEETLSLYCEASGFPYPRYQWYRATNDKIEFEKIPAESRSSCEIQNIRMSDAGAYTCRIHNNDKNNILFTDCCKVTVLPPLKPAPEPDMDERPIILTQPESQKIVLTKPFSLSCQGSGNPSPVYQWIHDERTLDGENKAILSVDRANDSHTGKYWCQLSNSKGTVSTDEATIKVFKLEQGGQNVKPYPVEQPASIQINEGGDVLFFFIVGGKEQISYQWYHEGEAIEGATSCELRLCRVAPSSSGNYQCEAINVYGKCLSRVAELVLTTPEYYTATDKVALLIGNCVYKSQRPLNAPSKDVSDIKKALKEMDFKVVSLLNLNKDDIEKAVDIFCQLIDIGVYAVFYFAGHGFEEGGQCYLVPQDAPAIHQADQCVCAEYILQKIQQRNPALAVLLLDICRKNENPSRRPLPVYNPTTTGNTVIGYATSFQYAAFEESCEYNSYKHYCNLIKCTEASVSGIFMKHLKEYIKQRKDVPAMLHDVHIAIGHDNDAKDIQFPETRHNTRDKRCLTDRIAYRTQTQAFEKRVIDWMNIRDCPHTRTVHLKMGIEVELTFEPVYSNILKITAFVRSNGQAETCRVWLESSMAYDEKFLCDQEPVNWILAQNLQELRGELEVTVNVHACYNRTNRPEQIRLQAVERLGRPLIANHERWSRPSVPARTPVEQDDFQHCKNID